MGKVIHIDEPDSGGGTGTGWDGEVNQFNDLPFYLDNLLKKYLVLNSQGSRWTINLKPSGLYIADSSINGWRKLSDFTTSFLDNDFAIINTADTTKQIRFDASTLTTARTLTTQDKDGTIALLSDLPDFSTLLENQIIFGDGANGYYYDWLRSSESTFPFPNVEGAQGLNWGQGYGILTDRGQGMTSKIASFIDQINFNNGQTGKLRFGIMDTSYQLLAETFIELDENTIEGYISSVMPMLYNKIPNFMFLLIGANENQNGGQTVNLKRVNANQTNNDNVCFTFNMPATGGFPVDLSDDNDRNQTNNVFYIKLYSE